MDNVYLQTLFPEKNSIPPEYQLQPIHQKEYLINGVIKIWEGEVHEVYSPICVQANGRVEPVKIGSYPRLNEQEVLNGLNAAVAAYDNGCGACADNVR